VRVGLAVGMRVGFALRIGRKVLDLNEGSNVVVGLLVGVFDGERVLPAVS
jgi:hypothetical protein